MVLHMVLLLNKAISKPNLLLNTKHIVLKIKLKVFSQFHIERALNLRMTTSIMVEYIIFNAWINYSDTMSSVN
jgi:hypothetical protein